MKQLTMYRNIEITINSYSYKIITAHIMKFRNGEINMNTTIREMTAADKEAVIEMMRIFYTSPAVFSNGSEEIFASDVENCVNDNPYLEGYIFEHDGKIQGYAMVAKSFSTEFGKTCLWIEDLYMKEEYRGLGIGTQFFDFLEKKYTNVVMRLEVEEENQRAIHVYKKCGYDMLPYWEMKKENR